MVRLPRVVQQLDRREDVDVVYMNGDTPCCFFLLQSTRSVSSVIMIVVVLGAFACLIRWRKNLLVRRQIAECINDVFVQRRVRS